MEGKVKMDIGHGFFGFKSHQGEDGVNLRQFRDSHDFFCTHSCWPSQEVGNGHALGPLALGIVHFMEHFHLAFTGRSKDFQHGGDVPASVAIVWG